MSRKWRKRKEMSTMRTTIRTIIAIFGLASLAVLTGCGGGGGGSVAPVPQDQSTASTSADRVVLSGMVFSPTFDGVAIPAGRVSARTASWRGGVFPGAVVTANRILEDGTLQPVSDEVVITDEQGRYTITVPAGEENIVIVARKNLPPTVVKTVVALTVDAINQGAITDIDIDAATTLVEQAVREVIVDTNASKAPGEKIKGKDLKAKYIEELAEEIVAALAVELTAPAPTVDTTQVVTGEPEAEQQLFALENSASGAAVKDKKEKPEKEKVKEPKEEKVKCGKHERRNKETNTCEVKCKHHEVYNEETDTCEKEVKEKIGEIKVKVTGGETEEKLEGVRIVLTVDGVDYEGFTNDKGYVKFQDVNQKGEISVTAALEGYEVVSIPNNIDNAQVVNTINIKMARTEDPEPPVVEEPNNPPIADAGLDQEIATGNMVSLDGSASYDPDGDALSYTWTQVAGPAVTLSDSGAAFPTFNTAEAGTYTFELTVSDGTDTSAPDTVAITVMDVECYTDFDCDDADPMTTDVCYNPGAFTSYCESTYANDWVFIPGGEFYMGCDSSDSRCGDDESPMHIVYVTDFSMQKYEVTNAEYADCVAAGACTAPKADYSATVADYYTNPAYERHPVVNVDWAQAGEYCAWTGGRLPTEAEWEKAARGPLPDERFFPWGDADATCALVNGFADGVYCEGDTVEVGTRPAGASPYGIMDMSGNVGEWVSDWYGVFYYSSSPYEDPTGPDTGTFKIVRGGGWNSGGMALRSLTRAIKFPTGYNFSTGFRCVQ